jgi:hypothetical protein
MYFSLEEAKLIRAAAQTMPLTHSRDIGKAQLSSLTDYAAASPKQALFIEIDARARSQPPKLPSAASRALRALLDAICLAEEELERLPDRNDARQVERALRHKRARALRYVNKLREPG